MTKWREAKWKVQNEEESSTIRLLAFFPRTKHENGGVLVIVASEGVTAMQPGGLQGQRRLQPRCSIQPLDRFAVAKGSVQRLTDGEKLQLASSEEVAGNSRAFESQGALDPSDCRFAQEQAEAHLYLENERERRTNEALNDFREQQMRSSGAGGTSPRSSLLKGKPEKAKSGPVVSILRARKKGGGDKEREAEEKRKRRKKGKKKGGEGGGAVLEGTSEKVEAKKKATRPTSLVAAYDSDSD